MQNSTKGLDRAPLLQPILFKTLVYWVFVFIASLLVAAKKRHCVGDQHRLADDECRASGKHEVADRNGVLGED